MDGITQGEVMNINAILLIVSSTILISACSGGSPGSKVEYSDKVAAGTVEDYTNANWLYQNYFGDYGLPEEVKPNFLPALQMLANGFVMQLKTGQDVKKNIEQVHSLFLQYGACGEVAKFFSQVQTNIQNSDVQVTKKTDVDQNTNFVEPVISDEDKVAIQLAKQRDLAEEQEIKKLAEKYQLPYKILEQKEQWFIYTPTMKGGGKGGGINGPHWCPHGDINSSQLANQMVIHTRSPPCQPTTKIPTTTPHTTPISKIF